MLGLQLPGKNMGALTLSDVAFSDQCPQYPRFSPHFPVLWWLYDVYTRGPFYRREGDVGAWQTCQSCWLCLWLECQTEPTVTDWGVVVVEGADSVSSKWLQGNIEVGGVKAKKKKKRSNQVSFPAKSKWMVLWLSEDYWQEEYEWKRMGIVVWCCSIMQWCNFLHVEHIL